VVCKLIWAAGFIATMVFEWPLLGIPLSVLFAELIRLPISFFLVRRHLNVKLAVDWKKIVPVLRSSLPFYVNAVALVVVNRFDVNVLKVRSNDTEIGLYSAAAELAQMTFVMVPMMSGVVMPLFARMQTRGVSEYREVVRRTLELVLVLAFPPSLAIAVGADVWVGLVLGEQYAASAWALSILGPTFLLTYTAVVISQTLNLGGEGWTVTLTSLMSMFVHPLLVMVLVDTANGWGAGGAGAACAIAAVASETLVLTIMLYRIGGWVVDKRLLKMIVKTLLACAVVMVVDRWFLSDLGRGRVLLDGIIYVILVLGSGAVRVGDTLNLVRTMRAQRNGS
jgi:O-antigen/teichoic acid export membrane protein